MVNKNHILEISSQNFQLITEKKRTLEYVRNRGYEIGDTITFQEYVGNEPTGCETTVTIKEITEMSNVTSPSLCVIGIAVYYYNTESHSKYVIPLMTLQNKPHKS